MFVYVLPNDRADVMCICVRAGGGGGGGGGVVRMTLFHVLLPQSDDHL